MTPQQIIRNLRKNNIAAESWQTGGGCGAVGIALSTDLYILITPNDGPWPYGDEETDYGNEWSICAYSDEHDGWVDSNLEPFGTTILSGHEVTPAVNRLMGLGQRDLTREILAASDI